MKERDLFYVEMNNRGGGQLYTRRIQLLLMLIISQKNHIDAIVNKGMEEAWRLTGFYGEPMTHKRFDSWSLLHQLINQMSLPWICTGDFNELLKSSKKLRGSMRGQFQMQIFRDVINECGFLDLGFIRPQFTWQKHFADGHSIWERLDWAFANNDWFLRFTRTREHHLNANSSNHCPLG